MWSIGCILASAIFRKLYFFNGANREDQLLQIVRLLGTKAFKAYCEKYRIDAGCNNLMVPKFHGRKNGCSLCKMRIKRWRPQKQLIW